jgi:mannose-6-phosphate isomerase-like protein (cupin superfamily)
LETLDICWVKRPWGRFVVVYEAPGVWIKTLEIESGCQLSLQYHRERTEVWHCPEGRLSAIIGDEEVLLDSDKTFFVPAGTPHRIMNMGRYTELLTEIAFGNPDENDIVRLADDYGRED